MTVRLNRIGNEIVVPLPREELSRMGLDEGSEVEVRVYREPRRFVITPVGEPPDQEFEEMMRHYKQFARKYSSALRKLAE